MARDEIDEIDRAYCEWSREYEAAIAPRAYSPAENTVWRAAYVAALRRAEKVCLSWADDHLESARVKLAEDGLAGSAAEHECAAAIGRMMAERIASLLPKEPGGGEGK